MQDSKNDSEKLKNLITEVDKNEEQHHEKMNAKKQSKIKKIMCDVFRKSTMHGVKNIANSKLWLIKTIWIIFLIVNILLFSKMAFLSILNYSKNEVTTKIRTVHERPTLFPMASSFFEFI